MRARVAVGLVAFLLVAGIALVGYGQVRPAIDARQAATIAEKFLVTTNGSAWPATSETLSYDGNRPNFLQGQPATCWGSRLPFGGGCLPYPVWLVHLVGLTPDGQCDAEDVYVDGRTGKVHQFRSADCP
jgi:hypothetical protein